MASKQRRARALHAIAVVALLGLPFSLSAGVCTADPIVDDSHHELQFFGGYSPQSATLIGTATDRRFVMAGLSYSYRCWAWKSSSISYTAGVMPAAILFQPAEFVRSGSFSNQGVAVVPGHAVYGFGVTPIGFSIEFARDHRLHPFVVADGGIIASAEPIPDNITNATAVNFLFDFGGGLQVHLDRTHAVSLGYKFLHISNAGRTVVNPGVDNNVFYVGFSFLR